MPFGNVVLVGSMMRVEVTGLFLPMTLIMMLILILIMNHMMIRFMIRMNGPEIPAVGMGRYHMGAVMVLIGMGMEKKERREGEEDVGGQHEAEKAPAFSSRIQLMEG